MGEDAQSSLVGRCAGVEDPRRRRGATNSCSDSARGSHEHECETAPSLPVAAWARSVLCCGRAPTNQVGQRGWEANRENLPSASSMTPPLQRASLGAAISVAETRGTRRSKCSSRLAALPFRHPQKLAWKPPLAASPGLTLLLTPTSAVEPQKPPGSMTGGAAMADATTGQGGSRLAWPGVRLNDGPSPSPIRPSHRLLEDFAASSYILRAFCPEHEHGALLAQAWGMLLRRLLVLVTAQPC
jgi:hypothetical protein